MKDYTGRLMFLPLGDFSLVTGGISDLAKGLSFERMTRPTLFKYEYRDHDSYYVFSELDVAKLNLVSDDQSALERAIEPQNEARVLAQHEKPSEPAVVIADEVVLGHMDCYGQA